MKNNLLTDVQGAALRLYRGGKDESTFGPFLEFEHNTLDNVGHGDKNKYETALSLYGSQVIDIKNNLFNRSKGIDMHLVVGEPIVNVTNNDFYKSDLLKVTGDQQYNVENLWTLPIEFADGNDYILTENSPLVDKATDGSNLGRVKK
ncbi:MAG: hypothetical protein HKN31_02100 [Pricia sp.]|nr:hypothetical protein [Pricia sp.]